MRRMISSEALLALVSALWACDDTSAFQGPAPDAQPTDTRDATTERDASDATLASDAGDAGERQPFDASDAAVWVDGSIPVPGCATPLPPDIAVAVDLDAYAAYAIAGCRLLYV